MKFAQKRNYPKIRNAEQPTLRPIQYSAMMINVAEHSTNRGKHTQYKMRSRGGDEEGDLLPGLHRNQHSRK